MRTKHYSLADTLNDVDFYSPNGTIIYLDFRTTYFKKNDILETLSGGKIQILEVPHKVWYKQLLQWITIGLYKAPTQYKCQIIK